MKKKYSLLYVLLVLFSISVKGQRDHVEMTYSMLPICGMEKKLSKMNFANDTNYIFHFKPNSCPRCEAAIFSIAGLLHKYGIKPYIILDVPDKIVVKEYIKNNPLSLFKNRIVVDTVGLFRQFIDYNKTSLNIPYLYKINRHTGKFYVIAPLLSDITDSLIEKWLNAKESIQCKQDAAIYNVVNHNKDYPDTIVWDKVNKLSISNQSITTPTDVFLDNEFVGLCDMKSNKVYTFKLKDFSNRTYTVDTTEYFLYWDKQAKDIYNYTVYGRRHSLLRVIYLCISNVSETDVDIVASVPKILIEYETADTIIEYRNKAVILNKNEHSLNGFTPINIRQNDTLTYKHSMYKRLSDSFYTIGVVKGWPATGTKFTEKMKLNPNEDPFVNEFYINTPLCAFYDKTGKHIGDFGKLPREAEELKLGYYYGGYVHFIDSQYFVLIDQIWGELQIIKMTDILRGDNIINKRIQLMPEKQQIEKRDVSLYENKINYFNSYKEDLLGSYIVSAGIIDDEHWYYIQYNKHKSQLSVNVISKKDFTSNTVCTYTVAEQTFKTVTILPLSGNIYELVGVTVFSDNVYLIKKEIVF